MGQEHSNVVVGFDFGHSAEPALQRAMALAIRAPWHVIHVVCVIDPHAGVPAVPTDKVDYQYAERVQHAVAARVAAELGDADPKARVHFSIHARIGKPAPEILGVAREIGADLIVVGSQGRTGLERLVLGSVAEQVVREAGCAVMVARRNTHEPVQLLEMREVEHHAHYVRPHRYCYEERRVILRPADWPLA